WGGGGGPVRACLGPRRRVRLAAVLLWPVGPDRLGLDLRFRRSLGLGRLPLRPLELRRRCRLVLGPGIRLGTGLGELALWRRLRDLVPAGPSRSGVWLPAP